MKYYLTLVLLLFFSSVNAQSGDDFKKFNRTLSRALMELSTELFGCKYKHYALKMEVNQSEILDIAISDSVDSLYRVHLIEEVRKIDPTPFFDYLKSKRLVSAVFIKRLTFSATNSRCPDPIIELSQISDFLKFNGKEFLGQSIWLEPDGLVLRAAH